MSNPIHLICPHCSRLNRLPRERLDAAPRCGSCQQALLEPTVRSMREDEFERCITRNELPVMVDFWATWCGPCQMMAPQFERAAQRLRGRALCAKLDIDQAPTVARRLGIRSVPTVIVFAGGKERARHMGAAPESQLIELAERASTA